MLKSNALLGQDLVLVQSYSAERIKHFYANKAVALQNKNDNNLMANNTMLQ